MFTVRQRNRARTPGKIEAGELPRFHFSSGTGASRKPAPMEDDRRVRTRRGLCAFACGDAADSGLCAGDSRAFRADTLDRAQAGGMAGADALDAEAPHDVERK